MENSNLPEDKSIDIYEYVPQRNYIVMYITMPAAPAESWYNRITVSTVNSTEFRVTSNKRVSNVFFWDQHQIRKNLVGRAAESRYSRQDFFFFFIIVTTRFLSSPQRAPGSFLSRGSCSFPLSLSILRGAIPLFRCNTVSTLPATCGRLFFFFIFYFLLFSFSPRSAARSFHSRLSYAWCAKLAALGIRVLHSTWHDTVRGASAPRALHSRLSCLIPDRKVPRAKWPLSPLRHPFAQWTSS